MATGGRAVADGVQPGGARVTTAVELPALDDPFDLDPSIVAGYERDGHAVVRGLASADEAAAYRPVIERAALDTAWDKRPLEERDT